MISTRPIAVKIQVAAPALTQLRRAMNGEVAGTALDPFPTPGWPRRPPATQKSERALFLYVCAACAPEVRIRAPSPRQTLSGTNRDFQITRCGSSAVDELHSALVRRASDASRAAAPDQEQDLEKGDDVELPASTWATLQRPRLADAKAIAKLGTPNRRPRARGASRTAAPPTRHRRTATPT